jgi:hypothetical protein
LTTVTQLHDRIQIELLLLVLLVLLLLQVGSDAAKRPLSLGATVTEQSSGLRLRVFTNAPGMHFYTGRPVLCSIL